MEYGRRWVAGGGKDLCEVLEHGLGLRLALVRVRLVLRAPLPSVADPLPSMQIVWRFQWRRQGNQGTHEKGVHLALDVLLQLLLLHAELFLAPERERAPLSQRGLKRAGGRLEYAMQASIKEAPGFG
jgi:hypothetical protein